MIQERTFTTTSAMFVDYLDRYPIGIGLGAASQASRYLPGLEGTRILVENYASKLQVETGFRGASLLWISGVNLFAVVGTLACLLERR